MLYHGRTIISGRQKFVYALLALLLVIFIAYYPHIVEPFLAFCFGGLVPGTQIVLSPVTVMWIVAGTLTSGFAALIFRMTLVARRKRMHVPIPVHTITDTKIEVQELVEEVVIKLHDEAYEMDGVSRETSKSTEPASLSRQAAFDAAPRQMYQFSAFRAWIVRGVRSGALFSQLMIETISQNYLRANRFILKMGSRMLHGIALVVTVGVRRGYTLARTGIVTTAHVAVRGIHLLVTVSAAVGRWTIPRLWKIDAELEIIVRKIESLLAFHMNRNETFKTLRAAGHEYRKSTITLNELRPKKTAQSAKQTISLIKSQAVSDFFER